MYKRQLSLTGGSNYHIAVVANLDVSSFTGSIEELKHKALTSTTLPATPLTMFGETDVENVQNPTNIMVHIQRSVFAVDITSNDNDSFELLDERYLMNGEASGYLQEDNPESIAGFISKPTDSDKLSTSQRASSYPRTTSDPVSYTHLNEMYLVAKSYDPTSREFAEVFDIASRIYPNEPIAIINASSADIEGGNNKAAIDRMSKISTDERTWNNMGGAYACLLYTSRCV